MRVDQALVEKGLARSRTEAQDLVKEGKVFLNGNLITKSSKTVLETDELLISSGKPYVSRGGEKLEGALLATLKTKEAILDTLHNYEALDIGSSTGGFTDCLLSYGVSHVDAVDVGTEQLHSSLRGNKNISLFENTDIRSFSSAKKYDIVVVDMSFISLKQVMEHILSYGHTGTMFYFLIKPQFEVGKGNTKKGIVKKEELVKALLEDFQKYGAELSLQDIQILPCHKIGKDGNQEYFLYAKK